MTLRRLVFLGIKTAMTSARIDQAIARIESALSRIDAAKTQDTSSSDDAARVTALVNSHEQLREDVAETLRDLDKVIAELDQ